MIFIVVKFEAKDEYVERWPELVAEFTEATRQEPGNVHYQAHRVPDQPGRLHLYEIYRDAEALAAHRATDHFQRYLLGDILPRLESRQVELLQPLATIRLPDHPHLPEPPKT